MQAGTCNESEIKNHGLPFTIVGEVASDGTLSTIIDGVGLDVDAADLLVILAPWGRCP